MTATPGQRYVNTTAKHHGEVVEVLKTSTLQVEVRSVRQGHQAGKQFRYNAAMFARTFIPLATTGRKMPMLSISPAPQANGDVTHHDEVTPERRTCQRCGLYKLLTDFDPTPRNKAIRFATCHTCMRRNREENRSTALQKRALRGEMVQAGVAEPITRPEPAALTPGDGALGVVEEDAPILEVSTIPVVKAELPDLIRLTPQNLANILREAATAVAALETPPTFTDLVNAVHWCLDAGTDTHGVLVIPKEQADLLRIALMAIEEAS